MPLSLSLLRPAGAVLALAAVVSTPALGSAARPDAPARPALSLAASVTPGVDVSSVTANPGRFRSLPTRGAAWTSLLRTANGSLGHVDLADQNNTNAARTLAAALVYARTGLTGYRAKAVSQLAAVPNARLGGARVLSVGRQVAGYAIAADVVGYRAPAFVSFMSKIRTRYIGNHGRWVRLTQTSEDSGNNWGAWAMASRVAADAYVNDRADLARAARVFRGFLGDRSAYAGFHRTSDFDPSWACGSARSWTPINRDGCGGRSGAVVEDISRSSGHYPHVDGTGRTYVWETLGGATLTATVLAGNGYGSVWSWSNRALLRAARFEASHGGYRPAYSVNQYVPWTINKAYGVHLGPVSPSAGYGREFGFTDWLG